jgi:hypothetical protein
VYAGGCGDRDGVQVNHYIEATSVVRQEAEKWADMVERLESLWDRFGSEEMQDLYFALDDARLNLDNLRKDAIDSA